jgi:hypothetical protein
MYFAGDDDLITPFEKYQNDRSEVDQMWMCQSLQSSCDLAVEMLSGSGKSMGEKKKKHFG